MEITKNAVVALQYEMYNADGKLLDKTEADEPMVYLHGGYDGIFPVVEEALQGKKAGDKVDVTMEPDDAFGEYDADLLRIEPLDIFPKEIEVGMTLEADDPESGDVMLFMIKSIADGKVEVDGNHPLAGERLRFVATVTEVRAASKEEISHGHVHGAHGHQH